MSEIFLDTETTGLSYNDGHKIVEVACIETADLVPTERVFHKLINPMRSVPEEAFKIHGFSTEVLSSKESFDQIVIEFIKFIEGKKLIIHNAMFDIGFLNHELRLLNKDEIKKEMVIDTLEMARSKHPGTSNSLDALCRRYNIDLSRRLKHNALLDCELLREVYINLLDIKEPRLVFAEENQEDLTKTSKINKKYSKIIIEPTDEELSKHDIFLKKELKKKLLLNSSFIV